MEEPPMRRRPYGYSSSLGRDSSIDLNQQHFESPLAARARPTSEIFLQTPHKIQPGADDVDQATEKWLADLELYQSTLEEMAEVSLDVNFKDELNAIEQWFEVLSVGERTAALYALLQQTTPVQIRFFITVLQKLIANNDPLSQVFSPTNLPSDYPMGETLTRQHSHPVQGAPLSPTLRPGSDGHGSGRSSILTDFKGQQQTAGGQHVQNGTGLPLASPSHPNSSYYLQSGSPFLNSTPNQPTDLYPPSTSFSPFPRPIGSPLTPWANEISRPKSATEATSSIPPSYQQQQPVSTPFSSVRRGVGPKPSSQFKHNKSASVMEESGSSYLPEGVTNWASVTNTPSSTISTPQKINAEILNSTAMKLAALTTVNNRTALDSDVKKLRRRGSIITDEEQKLIEQELNNLNLNLEKPVTPPWTGNRGSSPQGRKSGLGRSQYSHHRQSGSFSSQVETSPSREPREPHKPLSSTPRKEVNYLDMDLLQDTGAWLRSLRLHKYTDNLADLKWNELIELTDQELEQRGVNALGARRKMLKVFEQIKEAQAESTHISASGQTIENQLGSGTSGTVLP